MRQSGHHLPVRCGRSVLLCFSRSELLMTRSPLIQNGFRSSFINCRHYIKISQSNPWDVISTGVSNHAGPPKTEGKERCTEHHMNCNGWLAGLERPRTSWLGAWSRLYGPDGRTQRSIRSVVFTT